jgi:hypothetical protein
VPRPGQCRENVLHSSSLSFASRLVRQQSCRRDPDVDRIRIQPGEFGYEGHRADLAAVPRDDTYAYDTAQADRDLTTQTYGGGLQQAMLEGVARQVNTVPDHHVVAELQQGVVGDGDGIHVDAATQPRSSEPEIRRPATVIPDELRAARFALAVELVFADGRATVREKEFVDRLQAALRVDDETAAKIVEVLLIKSRA